MISPTGPFKQNTGAHALGREGESSRGKTTRSERLRSQQRGASLIEYCLVVGMLGIGTIATVSVVGTEYKKQIMEGILPSLGGWSLTGGAPGGAGDVGEPAAPDSPPDEPWVEEPLDPAWEDPTLNAGSSSSSDDSSPPNIVDPQDSSSSTSESSYSSEESSQTSDSYWSSPEENTSPAPGDSYWSSPEENTSPAPSDNYWSSPGENTSLAPSDSFGENDSSAPYPNSEQSYPEEQNLSEPFDSNNSQAPPF